MLRDANKLSLPEPYRHLSVHTALQKAILVSLRGAKVAKHVFCSPVERLC